MFKEISDKITSIEKKNKVDDIQIEDGTKICNLVRILLSHYLFNQGIIKDEDSKKIKKLLFLLKESVTLRRLPKNVTLCAVSDTDAQKKYNDIYYDPYMDPLHEIFDNYYVCDWPSAKGLRHENISKNHIKLNIPLSVLIEKIKPSKQIIHNEVLLKKIIDEFALYFDIDKEELRRHVYESIGIFVRVKKHVKKTLKKMAPSVVFIRAAYGRFQMATVQACKELNIKTIELQHGLIFDDHLGYIKKTKSKNRDCLPDEIYTWGEFFSDIIKKGYLFPENSIHAVGFPFMEKISNETIVLDEQAEKFSKKFKSTVLVAGQTMGNIDIFIKKVAPLDENIGYIFKPHPRDVKEYIFTEKNIMISDRKKNYYTLLPCVNANMTVCSTTMFDSICFGVPSIIVYNENIIIEGMTNAVDNETIYLVKKPHEVLKIMSKINNMSKTKVKDKVKTYFKNNSLQSLKELVNINNKKDFSKDRSNHEN